jgi:hypothetical protein
MALGQSAGILFRIKADSSQAENELRGIIGQVSGLGDEFAAMAGPAGIAVAAIAAIGTAAVVAGVALTKLALNASEYGSAIFDVTEKTGLAAETVSTLRVAAENSGSSFETVSSSVSKFAVLVGQANQGKKEAIETLEKYGIKSRDLNGALNELVDIIREEKDETVQAAIAKDLAKDRTGNLINTVKQLGGSLEDATENAKKFGITLGKEDVKAADDLGDAVGLLGTQVKAGAARFALQYAPQITAAITTISKFLADNKDKWAEWGRFVFDTVTGATNVLQSFGTAANNVLAGITLGLSNQIGAWTIWANAARVAIGVVTGGLSEVLLMLAKIGSWINANKDAGMNTGDAGSARDLMSGVVNSAARAVRGVGSGSTGSSSGGSKGGGGAQDTEFQDFQKGQDRLLESFRARTARQVAVNDLALEKMEISEVEFIEKVNRLKMLEIAYEIQLTEESLNHHKASAKEKETIQNKLRVLRINQDTQQLKNTAAIVKAENDALDQAAANIAALDKLKDEAFEKEKKRLAEIRKRRLEGFNDFLKWQKEQRMAMDPFALGKAEKGANGDVGWEVTGVGQFLTGLGTGIGLLQQQMPLMQQLGQAMADVFMQIGQAVGVAVKNFVLLGSTGTSFRKFAAEVIASVAQMAAVKAVFELAEGLAALALFWFTNNPKFMKAATGHFIAAATYGAIAGVATVAGRAVAGNSFNEASGSASGQDGSNSNGPNRYTTQFNGYGQDNRLVRTLDRINTTLGLNEETLHQFKEKFGTASPGAVVMAGARDASRDIRDAVLSEVGSDVGTTDGFMRGFGLAR